MLAIANLWANGTPISVRNAATTGTYPIVAGGQAIVLVVDAADKKVVTVPTVVAILDQLFFVR